MRLSKFNIMAHDLPGKGSSALYNTLTQGMVILEDRIVKGLERGETAGLSPEDIKSLEDSGVLVPDGVDEDRLFDLFYNQIRFANRTLDITLLTTMNCNFACSYCYEGELTHGRKHMSIEMAEDAVAWIKARAKENSVAKIDLQYHGGEPLLNLPVIEKVGKELMEFCGKNGIKFRFHIVSNGYLLNRETAKRIKEAGVESVKVTVDGPEEIHDSQRFLRGGGGTYRTIINNLLEIRDILGISIGMNYTKETVNRIPELLDELIEIGLGPGAVKRVGFSPVMPGEGKGKAAAFDSGCILTKGMYEDFLRVQEEVVKRGFWKYAEPEINPCPVVMATHFTINYDGTVYKCPAVVDRPQYVVGHVQEELGYNAEMYRSLGINTFDNAKCRDCAVLPLCLGGCRYLSLVTKGNFHGIDCQKEAIEVIALDAIRRMLKEDGSADEDLK